MARKTSTKKSTWLGFFNYSLQQEEKAGIRTLVDSPKCPKTEDLLSEMVANGYKVSLSHDESTQAVTCGVTGQLSSENAGWTLVIQHVELATSLIAAWFVCSEVFDWGKWPVEENKAPDW